MKIVWSPEAVEDLVSLRAYIAEDSPATAERTVRLIIESDEQLLPQEPSWPPALAAAIRRCGRCYRAFAARRGKSRGRP